MVGDRNSREAALNTAFRVALGYWYASRHAAQFERVASTPETRGFDVVRITPARSRSFELWLDSVTHLLSRLVEHGDVDISVTTFADYRRVGAVLLPFLIRQGDGQAQFDKETEVLRYELNVAGPEERFDLPQQFSRDLHLPDGKVSTTVPLKFVDGELLIPIRINGRGPFDVILDTGGAASVSPQLAAEVGIASNGVFEGLGSGGSFSESYGHAKTLQVGDVVLDHPLFSVRKNPSFPKQVVVGHELFQRFAIRIDAEHNRVTLTLPETFAPTGKPLVLPFQFQERMPEVEATVEGFPGIFCVDTGQNMALDLNRPFVEQHQLVARLRAKIPIGSVGAGGLPNTKLLARVADATCSEPFSSLPPKGQIG